MSLAIFDLDNTLLGTDSDHAWGEFLVRHGKVDAKEYQKKNDDFYQDYKDGNLDINAYLEFVLQPLSLETPETLNAWHDQFMQEFIEPAILPKALELLKQHRDDGDYLLIITATNSFITHPIAKRLGVDDIMATDAEVIDGRYTGKVAGIPCYQEGKVTRLLNWLEGKPHSIEGSYFYSDSHSDIPLLSKVSYPVAVDPDEKLTQHAEQHQWPILSLR